MQIKEIEITLGRTLNLGQFESAHARMSARATLNDGDDPDEKYEELYQFVYHKLQRNIARILPD